jgi:hypothetical protein
VKRLALVFSCLLLWPAAAAASDAIGAAIRQATERAMRPLPAVPAPRPQKEERVSERRVWLPAVGAWVVVPGHWERRISETQSAVPPLTGFTEDGRAPVALPAGERPPASIRIGP